MTREAAWKAEWALLTAERARTREQWSSASQALAAKARDPLGISGLVRAHPIAAAAIGAVAGGLLAKYLADRSRADAVGDGQPKAASPPRMWSSLLREAAVSLLVPWLVRMLKAKFGVDIGGDGAPAADPPASAQGPG